MMMAMSAQDASIVDSKNPSGLRPGLKRPTLENLADAGELI